MVLSGIIGESTGITAGTKNWYSNVNRRSQRKSFNGVQFTKYLERYPLPKPFIAHRFYGLSTVKWVLVKSRMYKFTSPVLWRALKLPHMVNNVTLSLSKRGEKQGIQRIPNGGNYTMSTRLKSLWFVLLIFISMASSQDYKTNICFGYYTNGRIWIWFFRRRKYSNLNY